MTKPIVLQLGGPIRYNLQQYKEFSETFEIRTNPYNDRSNFIKALKNKEFGDFLAIYRPFWNDGYQMGQWDKELIDLIPSACKIISMAGAGFDWIDIDYLSKEKGIIYCNGGWAPTESVGDNAIWHILSTFRNFGWSFKAALTGDSKEFLKAHTDCVLSAYNPKDHVLGVVGMGKIGYRIAEKASHGLGMKIVYYDLFQRTKSEEDAIGGAKYYRDLFELLKISDCVVLATPAFKDKFINDDIFRHFKKGGRFVNIARGKLVDTDSLVANIKSGQIYSAGLDVFYDEPHVPQDIIDCKTITLTCHNGGGSLSTWIYFEQMGMDNIKNFYENKKLVSPVNLRLIKQAKL